MGDTYDYLSEELTGETRLFFLIIHLKVSCIKIQRTALFSLIQLLLYIESKLIMISGGHSVIYNRFVPSAYR